MNGILKGLLIVSLASFMVACGGEDRDSKMDSAKEHLKDAGQSLKDAGADTKDAAKANDDASSNEAQ